MKYLGTEVKPRHIPLVTIIGKSGSGKTTLLEKLITELGRRGYNLATVKHHSHAGFEIDTPGKDSWRFAQAGAKQVVIAAPDKFATYWKLDHELSLDEIVAEIHDVDLILVEGYKNSQKPSIEVLRASNSSELIGSAEQRVAIASDFHLEAGVPIFHLDDIERIAGFIEERFLRETA
jgi:molybdopterin-guanine dinucleotide biosynthesis protein B